MTKIGDNSIAPKKLLLLVEHVERVEEEMGALRDDRKDIYGEAKARGYDVRTMRKLVAARKMDKHVFREARALEDTYLNALGLLDE